MRGQSGRACTYGIVGEDLELTTTLSLKSNGNELGVDAGEDGVPSIAGDADSVEALTKLENTTNISETSKATAGQSDLFALVGGAKDVAEFGLADDADRHDSWAKTVSAAADRTARRQATHTWGEERRQQARRSRGSAVGTAAPTHGDEARSDRR